MHKQWLLSSYLAWGYNSYLACAGVCVHGHSHYSVILFCDITLRILAIGLNRYSLSS